LIHVLSILNRRNSPLNPEARSRTEPTPPFRYAEDVSTKTAFRVFGM
jgi:hypothetical protein